MHLLAASVDDETIKLIIGIIVVIVSAAGHLLGKIGKNKKPSPAKPPKLPPRPAEKPTDWPRTPQPRGPVIKQQPPRRQKPVPQPARSPAPAMRTPPMYREPQPATAPLRKRDIAASEAVITRPEAAASAAQARPAIAKLMQPQTLRGAFVLTELLQPPVSLREEKIN